MPDPAATGWPVVRQWNTPPPVHKLAKWRPRQCPPKQLERPHLAPRSRPAGRRGQWAPSCRPAGAPFASPCPSTSPPARQVHTSAASALLRREIIRLQLTSRMTVPASTARLPLCSTVRMAATALCRYHKSPAAGLIHYKQAQFLIYVFELLKHHIHHGVVEVGPHVDAVQRQDGVRRRLVVRKRRQPAPLQRRHVGTSVSGAQLLPPPPRRSTHTPKRRNPGCADGRFIAAGHWSPIFADARGQCAAGTDLVVLGFRI